MKYFVVLLVIGLAGCLSAKKADRQLSAIQEKHPQKVAEFAREQYPCIPTKTDTTYRDTIIIIPCDTVYADSIIILHDTLRLHDTLKIRLPRLQAAAKIKITTVTQYVEDSAKIKALKGFIDDYQKRIETYEVKKNDKNGYIFGLGILLLLLLYLLLKRKKNENTTGKQAQDGKGRVGGLG